MEFSTPTVALKQHHHQYQHQQERLLLFRRTCHNRQKLRFRTILPIRSLRRCSNSGKPSKLCSINKQKGEDATFNRLWKWYQSTNSESCRALFSMSKEQTLDNGLEWEAIPDHPEAVQALGWTYVASCLVERVWRFALPALLASMSENLLPVALNSCVSQLVVFIGGPFVGALMDSKPRGFAFMFLSLMQTVSILISAAMILYALKNGVVVGLSVVSLATQPWFLVLVLASAMDRISGLATGVAFERDWVILLAGQTRTIALAKANAMLRRVDLVCDIFGPFLFGMALSRYKATTCVLMTCTAAMVSIPILILMIQRTYRLSNGVLDRPNQSIEKRLTFSLGVEAFTDGWSKYLMQPILPASIAYVLLSFNAVLAPSGLMTTFLTQRGLDPAVIGSYRGLCASMGFLATFLGSSLIAKIGALKAGAISLTCQAVLLTLAVVLYFAGPMETQMVLFLFLAVVVLSRLGHWAYDMVIAQIFQTAVPQPMANIVSSVEMSLASFAELIMLTVAIVIKDAAHFGSLSLLSMSAIVGAASLYWGWLLKPSTKEYFEGRYGSTALPFTSN